MARSRLLLRNNLAAAIGTLTIILAGVISACGKDPEAVYEAVAAGDLEKVERLVEAGAPLDWSPQSGFGVLHKALHNRRPDIARYLVEHGADVNAVGVYGITPLHIAGDAATAERMLEKGARTEAWSETLGTPLNAAVLDGLPDVAAVLIAHGAVVDARDVHRSTPLHHAAGRGDLISVRLLVEKGADVNAANEPGFTPLHWASGNGHAEVVALLLARGARRDALGVNGQSPLDMAVAGEHAAVAALLRGAP